MKEIVFMNGYYVTHVHLNIVNKQDIGNRINLKVIHVVYQTSCKCVT